MNIFGLKVYEVNKLGAESECIMIIDGAMIAIALMKYGTMWAKIVQNKLIVTSKGISLMS
jgi:hypothetical protein